MGTSGSYSGSGGKLGDSVRDSISNWFDSLPSDSAQPPGEPDDAPGHAQPVDTGRPRLDPRALLPIVGLLRPRSAHGGSSDGPGAGGAGGAPGGGGRTGGPNRSVAGSATTAGQAAAAAYAYRAGDAATLERLGLDYNQLSALGDPYEITRRIVEAVCGPRGESTIEDSEQRIVAAEVAEWVLIQQGDGGELPTPDEIARHTIGLIIADTALSEAGEILNNSDHADWGEREIREAAQILAEGVELTANGVTEAEITRAIEDGIEVLREILGGAS
jgi:hypothetical protein